MKVNSGARPGRAQFLCLAVFTAFATLLSTAQGGSCTPPPSGLVGWWPAEGNANDIIGTNNGMAQNISYVNGEVGNAFYLSGSNAYVKVLASSNLNVGGGGGFTFETWINPASLNPQPVAEWNDGVGDIGTHFFISESQYPTLGWPPGGLYANLIDTAGGDHIITTGAGVVATNIYQHIALTYDKASGVAVLYCNGMPVQTANLGSFTPQTSFDFYLGERASGFGAGTFFNGTVDEPSLYNRALSAAEIQAIYNAGGAGKCQSTGIACVPPPVGLAGWWPAEGNANDVIDGDNGALEGNATFAPGLVGEGFRFDGTNGYVQIPDSAVLKPTNVTCEAWVWLDPNLPVNRGGEQIVFKKNTWTAWFEGYSLLKGTIDNGNGTYSDRFQFCVSRYGNQVAINSQTIAQRGVWYHVAGTYDGNQSKLYVNGVLEASATPGFPLDYDTTPIFIGTSGTWAPYLSMFGGIIDEASIYGRALSTNEIQAIYNAGSAGKCTANESTNNCVIPPSGLVGWWKGEGNIADNVSGDNGTVVSGTVTYAPAEVGQGFNFDGGANRITVPDAPQLNFGANQDFSIEAWIQPDVAVTDYGVMSIVDKRIASDSTDSPNGYEFSVSNGHVDCRFGSVSFISAGPDLRDGLFHHVALTVSRNSTNGGNLFADGVVVLTFDPTALNGSLINSEPLRIGNHADFSLNCFFKGIIDEVSLYNRALATNEIQAIYNAGTAGKCESTCTPAPAGVVSWWPAEGNANDIIGTNNGMAQNISYVNGEVGNAFYLSGSNAYVKVLASSNLNVGGGGGFTFETWINPASLNPQPVAEWNDGVGDIGTHFFISESQYPTLGWPPGGLYANLIDTAGGDHIITTGAGVVATNIYQHIALTYDKASGVAVLYCNGTPVQTANLGSFTPQTSFDFYLGERASGFGAGTFFNGTVDEPSLYNRALSAAEIQAIYNAGGAGKCQPSVAPFIVYEPTNLTVTVNGLAAFSVVAGGSDPLFYQWSFNGTNIDGATGAVLTLSNLQPAQAGYYSVLVTNIYGSTSSSNALLTVDVPAVPPSILSQTPNQVVLLGNTATFSVNVSGSDPLSYFWLRNGALISDATNASYSLLGARLSDSGSKFSCLITNAYGSASSTNVSLKVIDTMANDLCSGAIVITSACYTNVQSTLKASSFGDPVPDCVDGFGHGVWYQFTAPVAGLLIVDTFGSDFDTGLAIYSGSCDALTEVACNDDTDGVTSQVTIPTAAGATYSILVGGYGSDAGNLVLHLNHLTPPAFVIQPTNQPVVAGSNATFKVVLDGTRPLGYQWLLDGNPLSDNAHYGGSTTPFLTISNVTMADATGNFSVTVTNILGSVTSSTASLNLLSITTQPVGRSVPPGLPTTFTAAASPSPAPAYQWQLNGTNISGATNTSYTIPAVGTNDLGFYHLLATYPVGVAVSMDAQLTFGPVAAWGRNLNNECLPPPGLSNVMAVAGSQNVSFALRIDGTIAAWGNSPVANIPIGVTNVVAIGASGFTANYALRSDGGVVSWNGISAPPLSNIVAVAGGNNFGYALRAEGTLTNWGATPIPGFPPGMNHLTAIAAGYNNAVALRNDGAIFVAGNGAVTNVPKGLNNVSAIAVGGWYAMALKTDGTVVAWGSHAGTNLPAGLTNIIAISADNDRGSLGAAGDSLGLAIRSDGKVFVWGDSFYGETNPPAALSNLVSIAGAATVSHDLALVNDGSPVILHPPVGLTAYTGRDVTLHGNAAGAAPLSYQWVLNGSNIPGATNTSLFIPNVQSGNAGNYQLFVSNSINTALSLAAPLTVVSNNVLTFLSQPTGSQTNYQGSKATLGVTVLGSGPLRYQWSYSSNNQIFTAITGATNDSLIFDPAFASQSGYYRVAVSNQFNFAASSSSYLRVLFAKAWGYLAKDPPFDVTNAIAIAVGNVGQNDSLGHYLALKSDGKISSWSGGSSPYGETNVAALSNSFVTAIAAGFQDSLALKSDGTVYAWGNNAYGETNVPAGLNGVTAIACGDYHDLALKSDGTVVGWGQNTYFQTTNAAATNVVAIAAGGQNSIALRADGSVVTWGMFGGGQYPLPFNLTNIVAVAAGGQHYLALRANGTVVGWGNNPFGQTTIPAGISNVVAISAGANHSVLLRNDGTVVTLGAYAGQIPASTSTPADLANIIAIAGSGDHDLALFGTRAPSFTVQPWDHVVPVNARTNITLAAKCAGVQPVRFQWQLNGTNVPGATNDTLILINNPSLQFGPVRFIPTGAYQLIVSNVYGVIASKYAKVTAFYPLADALDTPTDGKGNPIYNWTTSGNAPWFGETNITHDGVDAAQSGGIGALQETILQTTVGTNWSGRYTFWWKVSSEQDFDFLEFRLNGITQMNISGQVDWQPVSIPVATGTNVLQWRYYKDASFDFGQDAGWVDQFAFIPDPPLITVQPVSQTVNMGTNITMQVTAIGPSFFGGPAILRYQWHQNGNPIGGNSPALTLNNVGRAQNGAYSVTVTNLTIPNNGTVVSSNAMLKVLVPQLLGSPVLLPDGSFRLTSSDANGGLLQPSDLVNLEAQTSTNLIDWVTLPGVLSLTNGILLLQDATQSNYPARFYRLLEH